MKWTISWCLAFGILLVLAGRVHADEPPKKKWAEAVERLAQPLIDHEIVPSMVIGFYDRGEIEVFGLGRMGASGKAPDGTTIYEIGSVTKVFTGVLLAEAIRRKEVALDDPLEKFLPAGVRTPSFQGQSICLQHLATHRSALPRIPERVSGVDLTLLTQISERARSTSSYRPTPS